MTSTPISPENGARVASPVVVRFGLRDMGVAPAGVAQPQTGHHHLILDAEIPPAGLPIPKNDHYLHFGGVSPINEQNRALALVVAAMCLGISLIVAAAIHW